MAVEIPVVVDIDGAFQQAASRVSEAVKPLQRELSKEALEVQVGVITDGEEKLPVLLKDIKEQGIHSMGALQTAIQNVTIELAKAAEVGDKARFTALLEAKAYLDDMAVAGRRTIAEMDGLSNTMQGLSARIQSARTALETTNINSPEFERVAESFRNIVKEQERVQQKLAELGTRTGSLDALNIKLQELQKRWSSLGERRMYDSSGALSKEARKIQEDYTKTALAIEKQNNLLTDGVRKQHEAAEAARRRADAEEREIEEYIKAEEAREAAEKRHQEELKMSVKSLDDLRTKLAAWQQELNSSDIGSEKWLNAAKNVAVLSQYLKELTARLAGVGLKVTSIDGLNAKIQALNQQWNKMSVNQKYTGLDFNELTAQAKDVYNEYKEQVTALQQHGKSLDQILQKELRVKELVEKRTQRRKYENAILNATHKSITVLKEQERILSDRLSRTELGSKKYKDLQLQLAGVRREIEAINGTRIDKKVSDVNTELDKTNSRIGVLIKNAVRLAALHTATNFVRNVRNVTAEFEMQRVALGGIIQDTQKAESLFTQIKAAAIKSPFEIKDLVSFTKQLSAYRVETDKLFDVTMRLADVSSGLGVDMSRLVLAYGQVRAASVLRGQELRQFTEAGIPLVDLLAKKFSQLRNETVSTAEVFDLISKRAVSFSMIEEIFNDMTSAGGTFYKMQELQSETLKGQWMNLKDSVSIMYDEIGNTGPVNDAMKLLISSAKTIFENWRLVAGAVGSVGVQFAAMKVASLFVNNLTKSSKLARLATIAHARAEALRAKALETGKNSFNRAARSMLVYEIYMKKASVANNLFMRGWYQLMAAMSSGGGWIGLVITALTALGGALIAAGREARQLGKDLAENTAKAELNVSNLERNFKRLTEKILGSVDGSAEQRDALKELQRTYGDILPVESLQVEKLRELNGEYKNVNQSIRDYIFLQTHQQNVETIEESYGKKIGNLQRKIQKALINTGKFTRDEAVRIVDDISEYAEKNGKVVNYEQFRDILIGATGMSFGDAFDISTAPKYAILRDRVEQLSKSYINLDNALKQNDEDLQSHHNNLGIYSEDFKQLKEDMEKMPEGFRLEDVGTYEFNTAKLRQNIKLIGEFFKKEIEKAGLPEVAADAYTNALTATIDFKKLYKDIGGAKAYQDLKKTVDSVQDLWGKMAPQESTTRLLRDKMEQFAEAVHLPMQKFQGNVKQDGQSIVAYTKSIQDAIEEATTKLNEMNLQRENQSKNWSFLAPSKEEVKQQENYITGLTMMLNFLREFVKTQNGGSGYKKDNWITMMENRMKFMQDYKKGYDDFTRYLSESESIQKIGDIMFGRGISLDLSRDEQARAANDLSKWYEDAMKQVVQKMRGTGLIGVDITDFLALKINPNNQAQKDLQKLLQSLWDAKTDLDTKQMAKTFDDALKKLEEEVKRSETAQNFYRDILGLTGEEQLATDLTVAVYGDVGNEFKDRIQKQLNAAFETLDWGALPDDIWGPLDLAFANQDFDYIKGKLELFPEDVKKVLERILDDVDKYNASLQKKFADAVAKSGDSTQKIATIRAKADQDILDIITAADMAVQKTPDRAKEIYDAAKRAIKAIEGQRDLDVFKAGEDYVKYFAELNVMTAEQATTVRGQLRDAYIKAFRDGTISADELYHNLRAVETQFRKLTKYSSDLTTYLSDGIDGIIKRFDDFGLNIQVIGQKIAKNIKLDTGEEAYVNNMLRRFGKEYGGEALSGIKSLQELFDKFPKTEQGLSAAGDAISRMGVAMSTVATDGTRALAVLDAIFKSVNGAVSGVQQFYDELNRTRSGNNQLGGWVKYISDLSKYISSGWEKLTSGDILGATMDLASAVASVFSNIQEDKVERINKKIEEQEELIDSLSRAYSRLQSAEEKVFGADIITNYNQRIAALQAQEEAYRKQAALEREKGKSADEQKAKDYEKSAIDIANEIADLQTQLSEKFSGTDLASASRDFASSWIDAYKSFSSTTDVIKEKFQDMIQNMIVESLAAKVVEKQLRPIFKLIDSLSAEGNQLSLPEIQSIANRAKVAGDVMNQDLTNLMNALNAVGLNMRTMGSGLTGIAKDIQGASEESILGLAAGVNTQNFYLSQINANVGVLVNAIANGASPASPVSFSALAMDDPMREHVSSINTNVMLIAERVESLESTLRKVVYPKGTNSTTHYVAIQ